MKQMRNHWYIVAATSTLKDKPLARRVLGEPLVVFRGALGQAAVLADRCPHRNVQLSGGKVCAGKIRCPYHGWEFDATGACVTIPSLCGNEAIPSQAVAPAYPVVEQDGYIWVWVGDEAPNGRLPFQLPHRNERGWGNARLEAIIPNSVDNVVENFIDCPHTGYVHGGLFRTPASHMARTRVRAVEDGVVIDIDEENQADSLLARLLVKKGAQVTHQDRFILPSIVQVAYGFGPGKAMTGFQICTPEEDFVTRVYVYLTWSFGWLTPLMTPFMPAVGKMVLNQDMGVLVNQGEMIQRHGKNFTSAPADTANLWIQAARQKALRGQAAGPEREKQVDFRL
jgi:phenylpropionate dioxygenase-like ring-hydroxylating dioxygenase large terminal subunit